MRMTNLFAAFTLGLGFVGLAAFGQDAKKDDAPKEEKKADAPKEAKKADAPKEVKKPITAIVGADVYTVTKGVIRNGVVLIQDGKILKVGQDVVIPEGAIRIDATGKVVTPGFVTVNASGVGISALGGGQGGGGPPGPGGGAAAAQSKIADSLNPFDRNIQFCLATGITTANIEVGGGGGGRFGRDSDDDPPLPPDLLEDDTRVCPCCGMAIIDTQPIGPVAPTDRGARRSAVIKMTFGDMSNMVVKETPFYHLSAGSFAGAMNRHQWRETVKRAKQAVKDRAVADTTGEDAPAAGPGGGGGRGRGAVTDDLIKLVEKKIPLRTEAYSAEQMRDAIALAKELDYNLILDGVHEAWLIAGELGSAKVQTVLTPRSRRRPQPGKDDTTGSSIETSSFLEKAGVPFAVAPLGNSVSLDGLPGRDLTSLPLEAAFAVRGGCSETTALEALTIVPARMMGLADRIGSIEEGKDADLLILDGNPLDYRTYVEKAVIGGKVYYDRMREKIYPVGPRQ
jgi:imidazolonepropionase-like amidohydrolase